MRAFVICAVLAGGVVAVLVPALGLATDCQPTFVSPAICHPAHAVAPTQLPSGGDCAIDGMGHCLATPGTRCVDRRAAAVAGTCEYKLNYYNPTGCTSEFGVTVVDLKKYLAICSSASGVCQCEYTLDSMTEATQVEVCDCNEQAL